MARRVPNQIKENNAHYKRIERYVSALDGIYQKATDEAVNLALLANHSGDTPFKWSDYPQTKAKLDDIRRSFTRNIRGTIVNGVTAECGEANFKNDNLAKAVIGIKKFDVDKQGNEVIPQRFKRYFQNNDKALSQFISRKDKGGLDLSKRVWNLTENYTQGLEAALSTAIGKGTDAVTLSKRVSKYLHDYPSLKADYTEKFGTAANILDCEWRSARLARTEINMAYRKADAERWSQMDFVVGFEVKRSGRGYDCSVCESLTGKYPKDFVFVGWHPSCRCYVIPILKTDEEFWSWDGRGEAPTGSVNEVKDVPQGFKNYIIENKNRVLSAEQRGTLPYWCRDNKEYVKGLLSEMSIGEISKKIAENPRVITDDIFRSDGVYTPYRKSLHETIVDKYTDGNFSTGGDTVYMLGGPPANGKSTLVESGMLPHPKGVLVVDPDSVKARIPEYRKMLSSGNADLVEKAANFVHEESSVIGAQIRNKAFKENINTVLDGINDGSIENIKGKASLVREMTGKRIRADYCTLDTDLSLKLAKERAERTGRTVPAPYITKVNRDMSLVFPDIIKNNVFDELYLWDTNVNGTPRLILKQVDGKLHIEDNDLYTRFLSKGK